LRLRTIHTGERRQTAETTTFTQRSYNAMTHRYESEWSFRPTTGNRWALGAEFIHRHDEVSEVSQDEWGIRPSVRLRLRKRWSLETELRWAEVNTEGPSRLRPFFFPPSGRNQQATVRLGWDPTAQLAVSLSYLGRRLGEGGWQHDVRMESTARF
jgi:hypothetical protein